MSPFDKPLVLLHTSITTPPLSREARLEAGFLLRELQGGEVLTMPSARPMPSIGAGVAELRINDGDVSWRIIYRIDPDAIVVVHLFRKTTQKTPKAIIDLCKKRLTAYDTE